MNQGWVCRHADGDHQQQPIDPRRIPQATALQLEDARFLITEQRLTAEALLVEPDQIQPGIAVADPIPGLGCRAATQVPLEVFSSGAGRFAFAVLPCEGTVFQRLDITARKPSHCNRSAQFAQGAAR